MKLTLLNVTSIWFFSFQHGAHLESLLEENKSLTTKELHDGGVRTLCLYESRKMDLEKVFPGMLKVGLVPM